MLSEAFICESVFNWLFLSEWYNIVPFSESKITNPLLPIVYEENNSLILSREISRPHIPITVEVLLSYTGAAALSIYLPVLASV